MTKTKKTKTTNKRLPIGVEGGAYTAIILPDIHVPFEDKRSMSAVERFMEDSCFDHYIQLGDFCDMNMVSAHNHGKPRLVENERILEQYDQVNAVLDRHQALILGNNSEARMTLLEGNHEHRVERYMDAHPATAGLLEVRKNLRLDERGMEWVPCYSKGEIYQLGKLLFHHGKATGKHHALQMGLAFGHSIVYGHTHDFQSHSLVQFGKESTIAAHSIGCLCQYEQGYIGKNPTKWQQGFAVAYFDPKGFFQLYPVRIFNHAFFAPNGKRYKG